MTQPRVLDNRRRSQLSKRRRRLLFRHQIAHNPNVNLNPFLPAHWIPSSLMMISFIPNQALSIPRTPFLMMISRQLVLMISSLISLFPMTSSRMMPSTVFTCCKDLFYCFLDPDGSMPSNVVYHLYGGNICSLYQAI